MCIPQPSIRAAPCRNLAHPWPHHIPLFTFGEVPGICGLVLFALECEGLRDCNDRCEIPTGSKSTLTVCRQYVNRVRSLECGSKQIGLNAGVLAVHPIGFGFIIGGTGVTQRWSSMKSDSAALAIADRLFAWAALLVLVFVSHPVLSSVESPQQSKPKSGTIDQSSATDQKGNGVITGTVVNERHEPVRFVVVQAVSSDQARNPQGLEPVLRRSHTRGSDVTNSEGQFVISGLP